MITSQAQTRPALKRGLIYVKRSDGYFVGRREGGLLFIEELASLVVPLLTGRYTCREITVLLDQNGSNQGEDAVLEIIDRLDQAQMLDHDAPSASGNENWPELSMVTHRDGVQDGGRQVLANRATARVDIYGCGLIGANLARILAASGIGELRLIDQRLVSSQHLPVASLASVGLNAAAEVAGSLARDYPKVLARTVKEPTLAIVTRPPSPSEILTFMNFSKAHLLIEPRGDSIEVGPLVLPGRSSCLRCLTLDRLDHDSNWYSVELCGQLEHEPPAALAALAAGISALAALSLVDSVEPKSASLVDTTLRIDAALRISATPRRRHPRCGCAWGENDGIN